MKPFKPRRASRIALLAATCWGAFACINYQPVEMPLDASIPADAGIDAGVDAGIDASADAGHLPPPCIPGTQYVYVFTANSALYAFNPPDLSFTRVGTLNCPSQSYPFSMAVDRAGAAWVEYGDGNIFKVDINTATCTATTFQGNREGFGLFGMGFAASKPGGSDETLFVSNDDPAELGVVNTNTLALTDIGPYQGLAGAGVNGSAELTGTPDGYLYGAFLGTPFVLAQIDQRNASITLEVPLDPIEVPNGAYNFAFASWGGNFWFFVGPGNGTTGVYEYQPDAGTTDLTITVPFEIVGAGVSICTPT